MTNTTLSRRRLVQGAAAALALGAVPGIALANADSLLADILIGVGDAMKRDYIREPLRSRSLGRPLLAL